MKVVRNETPGIPPRSLWIKFFDVLTRRFPPHASQHRVVDMLQGNIDVARDLVALRDGLDQFVAPVRRVRVKQAHPEVALDFLNFAKKRGQVLGRVSSPLVDGVRPSLSRDPSRNRSCPG